MTKIAPEHPLRSAIVYIRQSTAIQVAQNLESQRRQYGLAERARQLGWSDVEVIDDDLGRSGAGARRPDFERLLAAVCEGRVGAVLSLEASRLARNGRDWHTLLEFCGLVGTLIIDEDGVYDAASPNDRLLLGMKGTMSEIEISVFRQRSIEAMRQKARRGELFLTVAVGYVKTGDRMEKDADRRLQEAIALVVRKFTEFQTIHQVLVWCRQEKILLPALGVGAAADRIVWRLPVYPTVHHMLTNPVYAGAYAIKHWQDLTRFLDDGRIEIDSNTVERAIKPQTITRKSSLFAGSNGGAATWACAASVIETCRLNDINPQHYLADVLARLAADHPASEVDALLPWQWATRRKPDG